MFTMSHTQSAFRFAALVISLAMMMQTWSRIQFLHLKTCLFSSSYRPRHRGPHPGGHGPPEHLQAGEEGLVPLQAQPPFHPGGAAQLPQPLIPWIHRFSLNPPVLPESTRTPWIHCTWTPTTLPVQRKPNCLTLLHIVKEPRLYWPLG